jgi:[protein-PII] uridylyltransferase
LAQREDREKFERRLTRAVTAAEVDFTEKIARRAIPAPLYRSLEDEHIPTSIHFDNETSATCTVLDLETEDQVGLLYHITRTLAELGLNISLARISTEKGAAVDSFYLAEETGQKILPLARQEEVAERLRRRIATLATARGS